jgi:signal transduction histidine kinase
MTSRSEAKTGGVTTFRTKVLVAMAIVVLAITGLGLLWAQRKVAAETEHDLQRDFQAALASLHALQEIRHAALAERCRALARRPRIPAALEDNALDLLYPSAQEELRDLMAGDEAQASEKAAPVLRAKFYRFLDAKGSVIAPPTPSDVGELIPEEEAQLALNGVPDTHQIGYLLKKAGPTEAIVEVVAMPISSTETGETIAAIVLGFRSTEPKNSQAATGMKSGIWLNRRLHLPALAESVQASLGLEVTRAVAAASPEESSFAVSAAGVPHRLFYKLLNPGSHFPPACEVCVYPLADLLARQRQLRWQAAGACALLLLGGIMASHFLSARLSAPVEQLAVDSEENLAQRQRAETALELTNQELQRSARFSADASHQLKTPVTVLRAGLDELLVRESLSPELREEISALRHQTFRLRNIIEDLLLLSQMDAGRLSLNLNPVNLTELLEEWLDDLSTLPDALTLTVETDFPPALQIVGEKRYTTIIVQNLLENARHYGGGQVTVTVEPSQPEGEEVADVQIAVEDHGPGVPPEERILIFERFARGVSAGRRGTSEGAGLGLALVDEHVRLHRGRVWVEDRRDGTEGARFVIELPAEQA